MNELYLKIQNLDKETLQKIIYNFYLMLENNKDNISDNITEDNEKMQIIYRIKFTLSNMLENIIIKSEENNIITIEYLQKKGFKFEKQNPFTGKPNWYFGKYQIQNPEISTIDTETLIDFDLENFMVSHKNYIKKCETIKELEKFIEIVKYLSE
jgi:hypothetical protein